MNRFFLEVSQYYEYVLIFKMLKDAFLSQIQRLRQANIFGLFIILFVFSFLEIKIIK